MPRPPFPLMSDPALIPDFLPIVQKRDCPEVSCQKDSARLQTLLTR